MAAGGAAPAPKQDELQPHPVKDQLPNVSYCITSPPPWRYFSFSSLLLLLLLLLLLFLSLSFSFFLPNYFYFPCCNLISFHFIFSRGDSVRIPALSGHAGYHCHYSNRTCSPNGGWKCKLLQIKLCCSPLLSSSFFTIIYFLLLSQILLLLQSPSPFSFCNLNFNFTCPNMMHNLFLTKDTRLLLSKKSNCSAMSATTNGSNHHNSNNNIKFLPS
jgi:hypothetical protein